MKKTTSVLRLIYPQWQGGIISDLVPELAPDDASRGYYLGAQLLQFLAPESDQDILEVPVSLEIDNREVDNGVTDRNIILKQSESALEILNENNPDRIVTLGGECSVSVVPFTYLAAKYPDDVAIIWIDAHPDLGLPYDDYTGYHAMALTACMGLGDSEIMNILPAKVDASKVLIVGLRAWEEGIDERQKELGIKSLTPSEVAGSSDALLEWLKETGVSKVVIHYDLDVLDPDDLIAGVGVEPGGMTVNEVIRVINDVVLGYDLIGLTVAEPMPRIAIRIKNMLNRLPLLKD